MELYINSPAYFTNMYGIDDEVYKHGFGNGMNVHGGLAEESNRLV